MVTLFYMRFVMSSGSSFCYFKILMLADFLVQAA